LRLFIFSYRFNSRIEAGRGAPQNIIRRLSDETTMRAMMQMMQGMMQMMQSQMQSQGQRRPQ
jgi:hypothetical protein